MIVDVFLKPSYLHIHLNKSPLGVSVCWTILSFSVVHCVAAGSNIELMDYFTQKQLFLYSNVISQTDGLQYLKSYNITTITSVIYVIICTNPSKLFYCSH